MKSQNPQLTERLNSLIRDSGAAIFGFCSLSSVKRLPFSELNTGISIGINLNPDIVLSLKDGPDEKYVSEYGAVNERLCEVAEIITEFLSDEGYNADFIPPTQDVKDPDNLFAEFPHKTAATAAGLGWIGKCALLITKEYGPALRIITVFTDAPLKAGIPVTKSYCGSCNACREACPAGAVSGKEWSPELFRDDFWDSKKCFEYSRKRGILAGSEHPVCGICISACPWTKKYLKREGLL